MPTTLDTARDYLVWDNREDVTYTSAAVAGDTNYAIASAFDNRGGAKWRVPTFKEMAASGGVYTGQDRVLLLPVCNMPAGLVAKGIKPRDRMTKAGGAVYTVLSADLNTAETWWKITGRNLVIANDLRDTIDVQRPGVTFDGSGVPVRAWPPAAGSSTPYAALACRVQPLEAAVIEERALRGFRVTHAVYLSQQVTLRPDDRIKVVTGDAVPAATLLQIRGYHNPNRIDEVPVIDAEIVP